jgi:hypothetical protein
LRPVLSARETCRGGDSGRSGGPGNHIAAGRQSAPPGSAGTLPASEGPHKAFSGHDKSVLCYNVTLLAAM